MHVSPIDALLVIKELNESSSHSINGLSGGPPYLDVSEDGFISPIDALLVIQFLNNATVDAGGEGEYSERLASDAPEGESPDAVPLYSQHMAYWGDRLSDSAEESEDSATSTSASPMPETVSDRLDLPSERDRQRDDLFASWDSSSNESDWDDLLTEVAEDVAVELGEPDRVWRER